SRDIDCATPAAGQLIQGPEAEAVQTRIPKARHPRKDPTKAKAPSTAASTRWLRPLVRSRSRVRSGTGDRVCRPRSREGLLAKSIEAPSCSSDRAWSSPPPTTLPEG